MLFDMLIVMGAKEYIFVLQNIKKKQVLHKDSTQIFKDLSNFLCKKLFLRLFFCMMHQGVPSWDSEHMMA